MFLHPVAVTEICFFLEKKLCKAQQVAIIVGANMEWKSLLLRSTLHPDLRIPKAISMPTLTELRYMLNDCCSGVKFGELI